MEQIQSATIAQERGSFSNRHVTAVVPIPSSLGALYVNAPYGPYFDSQKFRSAMRWGSFIHERRTVNRRAPVPSRNRCSIFALPDPN
jgi:hypothetical protein